MTDPLCDLCNNVLRTGDSVFTYWTPGTGSLEQAQNEPGKYFWAQDPEWGACQHCHNWLQQYEQGEITRATYLRFQVRRSIRFQMKHERLPAGAPVLEKIWLDTHVAFTTGVIESFLDHKIPEFREELQGMR